MVHNIFSPFCKGADQLEERQSKTFRQNQNDEMKKIIQNTGKTVNSEKLLHFRIQTY